MWLKLCFAIFLFGDLVSSAFGHGYIQVPAARNFCFKTFPSCKTNYNYRGLNCGGTPTHGPHDTGRCGPCGDKYGSSMKHVYPSKLATGTITATYKQGQEIAVTIHVTANHNGWFEFRIGDIGKPPITQSKLTHLLKVVGGSGDWSTRWKLTGKGGKYETIRLKLPQGLTCNHCVLQWWWKVGNSWGNGRMETFINCADVKITSDGGVPPPPDTPPPPPTPPRPTTQAPPTPLPPTTQAPPAPPTTEAPPPPPVTKPPTSGCKAVGAWAGSSSMDNWCATNCKAGYCPASMCKCN